MLIGRACSNVHDGEKDMGDNFMLKGLHRQSDVGFLTFYEHFGYFVVGANYKNPKVPVWIVQSESHYSVMFSVDFTVLKGKPDFDLVYYDELAR